MNEDGKRVLDAISSWWVSILGHGRREIAEAISFQAQTLDHTLLAGVEHPSALSLAGKLARMSPGDLGHAFFACDGASAVEIAMKMSHHFWRSQGHPEKNSFLALEGAYHGETLGALGLCGIASYRDPYLPLIHSAQFLPVPRSEEETEVCLSQAEELFSRAHERLAALVIEPLVQGANRMRFYPASFLFCLARLCHEYGVHLVADEIATGFGRTGKTFACEHAGVVPDFLCLSKAITGGVLPMSVVLSRPMIFETLTDDAHFFWHSHTYGGNPLACQAALATLEILEKEKILEKNAALSEKITSFCQGIATHPRVRHFRHLGMVWAFDVTETGKDFSLQMANAALEEGILLRPLGNTVYFFPPYILNEGEARYLAEGTLRALERVLAQTAG